MRGLIRPHRRRRGRDIDAGLRRLSACFMDHRDPTRREHELKTLIKQRVFGLALGYEDLVDHDELCRDRLPALLCGCTDLSGSGRVRASNRGKPPAGKSTLNRLELTPEAVGAGMRYQQVVADRAATTTGGQPILPVALPWRPPAPHRGTRRGQTPRHGAHRFALGQRQHGQDTARIQGVAASLNLPFKTAALCSTQCYTRCHRVTSSWLDKCSA